MTATARDDSFDEVDLAAILIGAAQVGLGFYIWHFGPSGRLPMHFDFSGQVDRWGDRYEVAYVIWGMAALIGVSYAAIRRFPKVGILPAGGETQPVGKRVAVLCIWAASGAMMGAIGLGLLGPGAAPIRFSAMFLSFAMLVIGAVVGKSGPSWWMGVRTPWARRSRLAWDKSNRLLGRIYFWGGLATLALGLALSAPVALCVTMAMMIAGALFGVIESWRVFRQEMRSGGA